MDGISDIDISDDGTSGVTGLVSRKAPWTLASFVLAGSSVGLLLLWFVSWNPPAGPEILASPVLVLSLAAAASGVTTAVIGVGKSERGMRTVFAVMACLVAGAPSAAMLVLWLVFATQ